MNTHTNLTSCRCDACLQKLSSQITPALKEWCVKSFIDNLSVEELGKHIALWIADPANNDKSYVGDIDEDSMVFDGYLPISKLAQAVIDYLRNKA